MQVRAKHELVKQKAGDISDSFLLNSLKKILERFCNEAKGSKLN